MKIAITGSLASGKTSAIKFLSKEKYPVFNTPPDPLKRMKIDQQLSTGIRSIDGLIPIANGQRVGIFAGSGVGKSVTMGMIARNTSADINVIALIGERGREVKQKGEEREREKKDAREGR